MRYLSDAWIAAADEAVRAAEPAPAHIVIDQRLRASDSTEPTAPKHCYRVRIATDPSVALVDCHADGADIAFTQTVATARSLADGTADAHQAFLLGDIDFHGDVDTLIAARPALDWLAAALEPVMAQTVWD